MTYFIAVCFKEIKRPCSMYGLVPLDYSTHQAITHHSQMNHNSQNLHTWSRGNPHEARGTNFQGTFVVNVWCGLLGDKLIKPAI